MNDQKALERGAEAERLLQHPLLVEAFTHSRESILKGLEEWPLNDPKGAEQLRLSLKILTSVRAHFERTLRDGKVAQFRIEEEKRRHLIPNVAEFFRRRRNG